MFDSLMLDQVKKLPEEYQKYLSSGSVTLIIDTFAKSHNLDEKERVVLGNGFILYLILLFNKINFIKFLTSELKFSEKDSVLLQTAMYLALPVEVGKFLDDYQKATEDNTSLEDLNVDIIEAETTLKSLRTMNDDRKANDEATYPSVQDDILNQKNNPPPKPPQWESGS